MKTRVFPMKLNKFCNSNHFQFVLTEKKPEKSVKFSNSVALSVLKSDVKRIKGNEPSVNQNPSVIAKKFKKKKLLDSSNRT